MRRRRRRDRVFEVRAGLACAAGLVLAFSVCAIFTYDFWTVAVTAAALFLLTATTVALWAGGVLEVQTPWIFAALVFPIAWGLLQVATDSTAYAFVTWVSVLQYAEAASAFWLVVQVCQSQRIQTRFKIAAAVFGGGLALVSVLQMFTAPETVFWLFPVPPNQQGLGPFQNPDHYAAFAELLIPVAAWEALRGGRSAALFGVMTALMYSSVIATVSRAGTVTATLEIVVLCMFAVLQRRGPRLRSVGYTIAGLVALMVLLGAAAGIDTLVAKFQAKDQFSGRREFFLSSLEMLKRRPWLGYGLGTWPHVYPQFAIIDTQTIVNHAHDEWIEWACEGGVPLFAAFLLIAGRSGWLSWKNPAALGIPAVLLHSTVEFPMREYPIPLVMMAILGWAEASARTAALEKKQALRAQTEPDSD